MKIETYKDGVLIESIEVPDEPPAEPTTEEKVAALEMEVEKLKTDISVMKGVA